MKKVYKLYVNKELDKRIGERIFERREKLNYSQEVLAVKAGLTRVTINAAEQGGHLRKNNLKKIAKALECSVGYLKGETDLPELPETIREPGVPYQQQQVFKFNVPIEFRLTITNTSLFVEIIEKKEGRL